MHYSTRLAAAWALGPWPLGGLGPPLGLGPVGWTNLNGRGQTSRSDRAVGAEWGPQMRSTGCDWGFTGSFAEGKTKLRIQHGKRRLKARLTSA